MADQETNVLEMSDEDFLKLPIPETTDETTETEVDTAVEEEDAAAETKTDVPETVVEKDKDDDKGEVAVDAESEVVDSEGKTTETKDPDESATVTDKTAVTETDKDKDIDYKTEYEKLLAPFKANGSEMQAKNGDDARSLMQMGANYNKNMAALKPQKKVLKLLEKNGLMDQEQLNYLIDLNNKNPEAITKLLKDSGMDPLDMVEDVKKDSNYSPTQHTVSDTEIALESVLEDIRATPTYERTLNIITKEWDDTSCDALATSPDIIKTINGHVESGIFDKVTEAVTYERSLGRLTGVTDFEAYKQMGDVLERAGSLTEPTKETTKAAIVDKTETPSKAEVDRIARKKGAAPVKATKAAPTKQIDPLLMSDEEFAKLDNKLFRS